MKQENAYKFATLIKLKLERDEFTSCWGRVEEFLVAGEQEIVHTKPFFFPFSSAATCTNHPLEVDQRTTLCQNRESLVHNPKHCPFSGRHRPRT
ncbi:hypothetical protein Taro_000079 [Colocasia esculenta]|uniref:Uncharacterized protein n=1 Tax=Colocasia esculenta TaxID=4460 RepID=A0A843TC42_COLES|nr:hypothetical protein [Colocasia esculenta]